MISIIVPIYNAEKYIQQCIESLIRQTYTNFEIILIDDGSTDNSPKIINQFQKQYSSIIRSFTQNNSGVSAARNKGIELALGEYITFVDSDDWVDDDYLENLISQKADLVISGLLLHKSTPSILSLSSQSFRLGKNSELFFALLESRLIYGPCNKLYRTELIQTYEIMFPKSVQYGEDRIFNYQYLKYVENISIVSKPSYHYRISEFGSLCSTFNPQLAKFQLLQWRSLNNLLDERELHCAQIDKKIYTELLFDVIIDNIMNTKQLSHRIGFRGKYTYCKEILSIPEIQKLEIYLSTFNCSRWIKEMVRKRFALGFTLLFYINNLRK